MLLFGSSEHSPAFRIPGVTVSNVHCPPLLSLDLGLNMIYLVAILHWSVHCAAWAMTLRSLVSIPSHRLKLSLDQYFAAGLEESR